MFSFDLQSEVFYFSVHLPFSSEIQLHVEMKNELNSKEYKIRNVFLCINWRLRRRRRFFARSSSDHPFISTLIITDDENAHCSLFLIIFAWILCHLNKQIDFYMVILINDEAMVTGDRGGFLKVLSFAINIAHISIRKIVKWSELNKNIKMKKRKKMFS